MLEGEETSKASSEAKDRAGVSKLSIGRKKDGFEIAEGHGLREELGGQCKSPDGRPGECGPTESHTEEGNTGAVPSFFFSFLPSLLSFPH